MPCRAVATTQVMGNEEECAERDCALGTRVELKRDDERHPKHAIVLRTKVRCWGK